MSTHLLDIKTERIAGDALSLTSFYGGSEFGTCIQVTVQQQSEIAFVSLTPDEVRDLWVELGNWLNVKQHRAENVERSRS